MASFPPSEHIPIHSKGRPRHRRSYSDPSDTHTKPAPLSIPHRTFQPNPAIFDFWDKDQDESSSSTTTPDDEDDSNADDEDDDGYINYSPPLNVGLDFPDPISFPRLASSPPSPPTPTQALHRLYTSSAPTPILLSNGKPLKSSLKSSSSSPNIPFSLPSNSTNHTRTHSAPTSPSTPRNVHFPSKEQGGLETVHLFSTRDRPASVSFSGSNGYTMRGFPFPRFPPTPTRKYYELDTNTSSPIPAADLSPFANVHLESLILTSPHATGNPSSSPSLRQTTGGLALTGTLLVRNIAYEKTVAVRFTLDEWHTTCEVAAWHVDSLPALPWGMFQAGSGLDASVGPTPEAEAKAKKPAWDRFGFIIHLENYVTTLERRILWLVASVGVGGGRGEEGKWWDNNRDRNYRVQFRVGEGVGRGEKPVRRMAVTCLPTLPSISPSPSPSSSTTVSSGSSSPTTPATPCSTSHPNSAHIFALEQTKLSRLRQFNLKKYAVPVPVSSAASVAAVNSTIIARADFIAENDTKDKSRKEDQEKAISIPVDVEGPDFEMTTTGRYARVRKSKDLRATSSSPPEVTISNKSATENDKSVTPHLPWEASRPSAKTVGEERKAGKSEVPKIARMRDGHSTEAGYDAQTTTKPGPIESPFTTRQLTRSLPKEFTQAAVPAHGIWRAGSGGGRKRGSMAPLDTDIILPVLPAGMNGHLPSQAQDKREEKTSSPLDSDSVYKALVEKWCFSEGPGSGSTLNASVVGPMLSSRRKTL